MHKLIICVHGGHAYYGSTGAVGIMNESKQDRKVKNAFIKYLKKHSNLEIHDISVKTCSSSRKVLETLLARSKKYGADFNVSIHLDSSENPNANGFTIYAKEGKTTGLSSMAIRFCKSTGFRNRGCIGQNSLYVTNHMTNAILLECGFVTSKIDADIYNQISVDYIGKMLAESYYTYLKNRGYIK